MAHDFKVSTIARNAMCNALVDLIDGGPSAGTLTFYAGAIPATPQAADSGSPLVVLTFSDPAHYDHIREDDRISLVGLSDLTPGKPVTCLVQHADGSTETLDLNHSYGASQIDWFRRGSALNLFHEAPAS